MKKIKSAYEIAMEKTQDMDVEPSVAREDEVRPILSDFFKGEIDAEELWQEFQEYDEELIGTAQGMLIDSLGLRSEEEQFKRRKEGIMALETLKSEQDNSRLEQYLNRVQKMQKKYRDEREQLEKRIKQQVEQNSRMQMKPVQTEDGRTVMQLESGVDGETRQKFNNMISQLEENYSRQFSTLIGKIKDLVI
ncbi:MAG: hypothetical protein ACOCQH_02595 [Halanaerobiales bacterium]